MDEKNLQTNTNPAAQSTTTPGQPPEEASQFFDQLEGELRTRFELLPTDLQKVILSSDYQTKLFELAKKHKLTYEKLGQLELETTMVLLGMTPPDEYKTDIANQLGLGGATLDELVLEINRDVFIPIREQLMGIYSKEEVEIGEKFANEKSAGSTPVESPYREPITPKKPGINAGAIPTLDKNEFDAKKEVGLNPQKNMADIAPIKSTAADPYREIPAVGSNSPAAPQTGATAPQTPMPAALTPDFLQKIPKIEAPENRVEGVKPGALNINKTLGGIKTMNQSSLGNTVPVPQNQSEALKGIANLKTALLGDIKKTEAPPSIVAKEEIVVLPQQSQTTGMATPVVPAPQQPVQPVQADLQPQLNNLGIPQITDTTITLNNVSQTLPGEARREAPKLTADETSELMRNIKLQINENQAATDRDKSRAATMQKIDSLIDFKKAGSFMPTKAEVAQAPVAMPPTQNPQPTAPVAPMPQKFTGDFLEKSTETGHIYDKDIDMLGGNVKKTGFFGKMKNFFNGKKELPHEADTDYGMMQIPTAPQPMPQNPLMRTMQGTQIPIQKPAKVTQPMTQTMPQMGAQAMPQAAPRVDMHFAKGPVSDADVDNVKIFDEITIQK